MINTLLSLLYILGAYYFVDVMFDETLKQFLEADSSLSVYVSFSKWYLMCVCVCEIQVPLVPFVPGASILLNVFLMMKLSPLTWLRFIIWVAAGT